VRRAGALVGLLLLVFSLKAKGLDKRLTARLERRGRSAQSASQPVGWTMQLTGPGVASVRYRNVEVGAFHYAFWGGGWSWASPETRAAPPNAGHGKDAFVVDVPELKTKLRGAVHRGDRALVFQYAVETAATEDGVVGGGLEFNLKLDSPVLGSQKADVILRPDNRGFDLAPPGGGPGVSVVFDPPIASVHFERGNQEQIRCFFDSGRLEAGKRNLTMTIRLPPGGTLPPSLAERYGHDDPSTWTPATVVWDKWPVDVSFLNDGERPAGVHGRLRARGDKLVFDDGKVARFWGTNLAAYALYTGSKAEVANQAKRIAALGYNLVRIHHHDSDWVTPNVFAPGETTQRLNDAALDAIDWWVKCLRDEGVYVWLDLKIGRKFKAGDGIPGFPELERADPAGRGFDFVDPRLQELEQDFAKQYLSRVNRYTGRSYLQDPAIVAALVTNEDDLTTHFGNEMLPDHNNPVHQGLLRSAIEASATPLGIPVRQALRTWEAGPSKLVLADIEARFFQRQRAFLHDLGFGGLVVGTSFWGGESLYSLASLATGDLVDVHAYGDPESLSTDPRFEANFIAWIGAAQLAGKPLSVSEWNVEYPKRDRFTAPLYVAAIGDLQGWDAPMVFNYSQDEIRAPTDVDVWSTSTDPAMTALMPAAAIMFRQQHVQPAHKTFCFQPSREALYGSELTPASSAALRTLVEQSRLVVALPNVAQLAWDDAVGPAAAGPDAVVVTDPDHSFLAPDATTIRSDTGELERDWSAGVETIDTPRSQAAFGWIGGRTIKLADVEIRIETPKATVALTSLDGQPIASSKKVLVTVVGEVAIGPGKQLPFSARPVRGSIVLRTAAVRYLMTPLSPTAHPGPAATAGPGPGDGPGFAPGFAPLTGRPDRAGQLFTLPRKLATHWGVLEPAPAPARRPTAN
jgi:hypothetical protein